MWRCFPFDACLDVVVAGSCDLLRAGSSFRARQFKEKRFQRQQADLSDAMYWWTREPVLSTIVRQLHGKAETSDATLKSVSGVECCSMSTPRDSDRGALFMLSRWVLVLVLSKSGFCMVDEALVQAM